MAERNKGWLVPLGIFYVGLILLTIFFARQLNQINTLQTGVEVSAAFTGSDWVRWEDREGEGVYAAEVHPLLSSKAGLNSNDVKAGDRLISIDGQKVSKAEVVERITSSKTPNYPISLNLKRPNNIGGMVDKPSIIINGFRLSYGFNERGLYWNLGLWIVSFGLFITLVIFAILIPLIKGQLKDNISLLGVVVGSFLLFSIQLFRNFYLFVEQDLLTNLDTALSIEKFFLIAYPLLLFYFVVSYFHFKLKVNIILFTLPSIGIGLYFLFRIYDIVFFDEQLKFYQEVIESYVYAFFMLHILGATIISIYLNLKELRQLQLIFSLLICLVSFFGLWYFLSLPEWNVISYEDVLLGTNLFVFFPLVNGTFYQLQFGKVRVVLTQTVHILFLLVIMVLYVLIIQIADVLFSDNTFRRELIFLSLLASVLMVRWLYQGNQSKFSKYFTTAQQEKEQHIKSFIAQIPRYTSSKNLRVDLVNQLIDFFSAETVHLWWRGDQQERLNGEEEREHGMHEQIYSDLVGNNTVWSKNKQIASYRFESDLEEKILNSAYTLVSPITISDESYSLLMLGKKSVGL